MIRLLSLELYTSISNITEENNKIELYNFPDSKIGGILYQKVRDGIEKKPASYKFYSHRFKR